MDVREKLVELLADRCDMKDKRCVGCERGLPQAIECKEGRFGKIADHMISHGVTVQEWVKVEDRLPEDDLPENSNRKMIRCLVATDKGTVKPCVRQRYEKKIDGEWKLCTWEWNKDIFAKPTYWMPLPNPPK